MHICRPIARTGSPIGGFNFSFQLQQRHPLAPKRALRTFEGHRAQSPFRQRRPLDGAARCGRWKVSRGFCSGSFCAPVARLRNAGTRGSGCSCRVGAEPGRLREARADSRQWFMQSLGFGKWKIWDASGCFNGSVGASEAGLQKDGVGCAKGAASWDCRKLDPLPRELGDGEAPVSHGVELVFKQAI